MQEQILLMSDQITEIYLIIVEAQEANINNQLKLITEAIGNLVKSKKSGVSPQNLIPLYEQIINNSFIASQFVVSSALGTNYRDIQQELLKEISGIANSAVVFESKSTHLTFDPSPYIKNLLIQLKQIKLVLSKQSTFAETSNEFEIFQSSLSDLSKFKFIQSELSSPANNLQGDLMGLTNKIIDAFQNFLPKFEDKPNLFKSFEEVSSYVNKLSNLINRTLKLNKDPSLLNKLTAYNDSLMFHHRQLKLCVVQSSYSYLGNNNAQNFGRIISGLFDLIMQIIYSVYYSCIKK